MLRNTVHRSICILLLTAGIASADRTVASGLTATPRATITGGEQLDAVGPRQPTKKEAAIIVVSLTLCERGDGAKCYEAAENIERLQLRLGKLHMPKALRARGRLMFQHQCDDGDANACLRFGEILFEDHETDAA